MYISRYRKTAMVPYMPQSLYKLCAVSTGTVSVRQSKHSVFLTSLFPICCCPLQVQRAFACPGRLRRGRAQCPRCWTNSSPTMIRASLLLPDTWNLLRAWSSKRKPSKCECDWEITYKNCADTQFTRMWKPHITNYSPIHIFTKRLTDYLNVLLIHF